MKMAWKALVVLGIVFVVLAFSLDTTVSTSGGRVHNIGLQAQQQMLVILGGFLFLAGIGLFGVVKLKQTPDEDAKDRAASEESRRKEEERVADTWRTLQRVSPKQWRALLGHIAFPLGLFFLARYLFLPSAEATELYLIAALVLIVGSVVVCGSIAFLWLSVAGLALLFHCIFYAHRGDAGFEGVVALALIVLPLILLRKRIVLLRDIARWPAVLSGSEPVAGADRHGWRNWIAAILALLVTSWIVYDYHETTTQWAKEDAVRSILIAEASAVCADSQRDVCHDLTWVCSNADDPKRCFSDGLIKCGGFRSWGTCSARQRECSSSAETVECMKQGLPPTPEGEAERVRRTLKSYEADAPKAEHLPVQELSPHCAGFPTSDDCKMAEYNCVGTTNRESCIDIERKHASMTPEERRIEERGCGGGFPTQDQCSQAALRCAGRTDRDECLNAERKFASETPEVRAARSRTLDAERAANMRKVR